MGFGDRHQVEEWVAEQAEGGVIVEIGCGYGNGVLALRRGNSELPIYGIDPYEPYEDVLGGTYGPDTLAEFQSNTKGTGVQHINQPALEARQNWEKPVALLWIDVSMAYDDLKAIFDEWQDLVIPGGWLCIAGLSYEQLGTARVAKEAVASGAYDYALHEQDLVAVLRKKVEPVKRACFYVIYEVSDSDYVDQACYSATSVKEQMGLETYLFVVNETEPHPAIDHIVQLPARKHDEWYLDSVGYMSFVVDYLSDYDELLYLDCDTYVAYPCGEMFRLLEHHDMALGHACGRDVTMSAYKVPPSFTTLGVGVNLFRNNAKIKALFSDWQTRYEADYEKYGASDEGPLRDLLFVNEHDVRVVVLPPEYHCRFGFGVWLFGRARILHGKDPRPLAEVAAEINSQSSMRIWRYGMLWYHEVV
jgi:hypothetical protein